MQGDKLSEGILKSIETIENIHLELAYDAGSSFSTFEKWHKATFNTETK
jgi:hypothetical protein